MIHRSLIVALCLAGCSAENSNSNSANAASAFIGLNEWNNRDQIADLVGVDPIITEWCAAFVNAILKIENIPNLNDIGHEHPLMARSFLDWGTPINASDIVSGDIVIFPRGNAGWQGHVGFYVGTTASGQYLILGGNQANSVKYNIFPARSAIGIRRWIE
jgi:uncharacterized protein (TIGR02594 family)